MSFINISVSYQNIYQTIQVKETYSCFLYSFKFYIHVYVPFQFKSFYKLQGRHQDNYYNAHIHIQKF